MALSDNNAVRRGGRPTRLEAAALGDKILDVATALFLSRGFGATSIEAVAGRARISKRTFDATLEIPGFSAALELEERGQIQMIRAGRSKKD